MVGNITLSLMVGKPAICCFVAIEKRHIAAALLLCPEDGARGLFSYLLCFSCWQQRLFQWLHYR